MHLKFLSMLPYLSPDDGAAGGGAGAAADDGDEQGNADQSGTGGSEDVTGLKTALEAERTKAKQAQRDLKTVRDELTAIKNAGRTEEEQREAALKEAQTRADVAEARLKTLSGKAAVTDAAVKANAISPKAVFALVQEQLEFDDNGEPTNIAAVIAKAKTDEPALFRASGGSGDGGAQGAVNTGNDMNAQIRRMAGRSK